MIAWVVKFERRVWLRLKHTPGASLLAGVLIGFAALIVASAFAFTVVSDLAIPTHRIKATNEAATAPVVADTVPSGSPGTTVPPPGPALPSVSGPAPMPAQITPTNPPSVVNVPGTPCTNTDLQASVSSFGLHAMGMNQDIVTVTSTTPCSLLGFPTVTFAANGAAIGSQPVVQGGTLGRSIETTVALDGPNEVGAFVLEYSTDGVGQCHVADSMSIGVPGAAPGVSVSLAPMGGLQTAWDLCGGVKVSAFEQGNDPGEFEGTAP